MFLAQEFEILLASDSHISIKLDRMCTGVVDTVSYIQQHMYICRYVYALV